MEVNLHRYHLTEEQDLSQLAEEGAEREAKRGASLIGLAAQRHRHSLPSFLFSQSHVAQSFRRGDSPAKRKRTPLIVSPGDLKTRASELKSIDASVVVNTLYK